MAIPKWKRGIHEVNGKEVWIKKTPRDVPLPATLVKPKPARKIKDIPKGEIVSRIEKPKPIQRNIFGMDVAPLHKVLSEPLTKPPVIYGAEKVIDWWTLVLGTPKEKTETLFKTYGWWTPETKRIVEDWSWKGADTNLFTLPGVEPTPFVIPSLPGLPDIFGGLKDIGKYALIGIAIIGGVILLSRIGGKK